MSRRRNIAARTAIDLAWKGADKLLKQVLLILTREAAQAVDGLDSQLKSVSTLADGMKDGSEAVQRLKEWGELE